MYVYMYDGLWETFLVARKSLQTLLVGGTVISKIGLLQRAHFLDVEHREFHLSDDIQKVGINVVAFVVGHK